MKQCSKCGEVKDLNLFYKLSSSKDGKRPDCKECCKKVKNKFKTKNSIKYRCNLMASGILDRTIWDIDKPKNKCYKDNNVKSEIGNTWTEISDYLYENFYNEIKTLIEQGVKPSVDRINSSGNYSPDNIRIIDLKENINLGVANAIKKISKQIKSIDAKSGKEALFSSISDASRELKIKRDTIYTHLDKGTICRKGYRFESVKGE